MTETQAQDLAREINLHQGWTAYAEEEPFINRDNHEWWVKAHHDSMQRDISGNPYPMALITSREEWEQERAKWGNP